MGVFMCTPNECSVRILYKICHGKIKRNKDIYLLAPHFRFKQTTTDGKLSKIFEKLTVIKAIFFHSQFKVGIGCPSKLSSADQNRCSGTSYQMQKCVQLSSFSICFPFLIVFILCCFFSYYFHFTGLFISCLSSPCNDAYERGRYLQEINK